METHLSKRLSTVADFVSQDAVLLDVGSDHAYLPIALLEKNKIERAIAGEVVEGPYQSAVKNVASSGLSDRIAVRLADGLAALKPSDRVTVITICGMGGRLIADILDAGKDKLKDVQRLVLQANNREDDLRSWLQANGFSIIEETIMTENNKHYEIIVAEHGEMTLSRRELRFGPKLLGHQTDSFHQKWERELAKLDHALASIPHHLVLEREHIIAKIAEIKEVIGHVS